ncbi:unnamed protein product [Adineta ricciae]|uniref:Uncharacterized protein n=1 Tax=Adineta ricciae TaxID=249248 RepID=A0A814A416_ADIRI|nr:unnamed protein product [Adineta ricciae]CAF1078301.1 unnamed protein product [Adineta ricciae]
MTNTTTMIIITADEDLIEKLASNTTTNTKIIDLDNGYVTNNALLEQLCALSTDNNQTHKRALESPKESRSKQLKSLKKSETFVCAVCGDRAIGYNYDVATCASCKVFFHRNALQSRDKLKCFTKQGRCPVSCETRRKCPRCRFDRCFAVGMRKDFILSEEERQQRKGKVEESRQVTLKRSSPSTPEPLDEIDQLLATFQDDLSDQIVTSQQIKNILFDPLSNEDFQAIENVRSALLATFLPGHNLCFGTDTTTRASALISWSNFAQKVILQHIEFFRKIPAFENLHDNDRFILIKYNFMSIIHLSKSYSYNPVGDCCAYENNIFSNKLRQFFDLCDDTCGVRLEWISVILSLVEITSKDPSIIGLLALILMFTQGLSMDADQPMLSDSLALSRARTYYTKILWNYLAHKCGEGETHKYFTRLAHTIAKIQTSAKNFRNLLRVQYSKPDVVNQMAPLLQTALQIA